MKIFVDGRILGGKVRGMNIFLRNILEHLSILDNENQYYIFISNKPKTRYNFNLDDNFMFYEVPVPLGIAEFFVIPIVINYIIKPDVAWFPANVCAPFIRKETKIITTIHDIMFFQEKYKMLTKQYFGAMYRRFFSKIAIRRSDLVHAPSRYVINEIVNHFNLSSFNLFYTYEGVDKELIEAMKLYNYTDNQNNYLLELGVEKEKFLYTISGTSPNKNLEFVCETFIIFNRRHPDYKLVISGAGNYRGVYRDYPNIIFTDYIDSFQKLTLLKNCKLFIFLSKNEGFGLPPLEALFVGCNVLMSDIPILRELYEGFAHFVNIKSPEEVSKKIEEILDKKINVNIEKLEKTFNWTKAANLLLSKFKEVSAK